MRAVANCQPNFFNFAAPGQATGNVTVELEAIGQAVVSRTKVSEAATPRQMLLPGDLGDEYVVEIAPVREADAAAPSGN